MNAEQLQLPSGGQHASAVRCSSPDQVPEHALESLFGKGKLADWKAVRRLCAGLLAVAAALGASLSAVAEPVQSNDQAVVLRTGRVPRSLSAVVEGPTRVALSWQAPLTADAAEISGYAIQFSDNGGVSWSALLAVGRRTTSFVHTVGLRPKSELLYRVFSLSGEGAGPAAVVSAATPAIAMPRIVDVVVSTGQGATRWYPPRRDIVVTVRFDQAVAVHTKYGSPRIDLEMGHPPHRQSGYQSEYSGGSGTDRLTFRYTTADWNQDIADIEVGRDALHRNGARITNAAATHSANLAHGPAILEGPSQVNTRHDSVLVMDSPASVPAQAAPQADRELVHDQLHDRQGGSSPALAAMLTAAGVLVAGVETAQQLALAAERQAEPQDGAEQVLGARESGGNDSAGSVAVDLGSEQTSRANAVQTPRVYLWPDGQTWITLQWSRNSSSTSFLIHASDDGGQTWENVLGTDDQGNDRYHPAPSSFTVRYIDEGLAPGTTRHYRVKARTSGGEEGAWSDVRSITTRSIRPVAACADAFWSTQISVSKTDVFVRYGYMGRSGGIDDEDFELGGRTFTIRHIYFEPAHSPDLDDYHFDVFPGFTEAERDDITLYVGPVALPLANTTADSLQDLNPDYTYHGYRWESTDYANTFGYPPEPGDGYNPRRSFSYYAAAGYNDPLSRADKVTVCLVDATPRVTLELDPDSISENGGTSTVTASVSSGSSTPFTVTVSAEPESPAVAGDFSLSTDTVLSFAANATESTGTVTITANDNSVDTANRTVTVKGEIPTGLRLRAPDDVTLTITDDDLAPELGLSVSPATIAEDGGVATVTVSTTGTSTFAADQTISLTFAGTASKGTDYTVSSETLTLRASERSVTSSVTAIDDAADESDETVLVAAKHDGNTVGTQQQITIADTLTAVLGTHSASVVEGGEATFAVDLSGGTSTADVEVSYAADTSSTATAGDDYTASSGKLTIAAGQSSGTITVATLTDQVLDPNETLVVKLTSATTDTRSVTVDDTATKTTTIQEEDMVSVSVAAVLVEDDDQTPEDESDDRSRVEEGETASFVVTLDGEVSGTVSVPYATANATAESGSGKDYTAATGTLEFTAGQTSKTIEVTTLEDGLNEPAETYTLTLTSVSGPAGVKLGTASATGTIEDDDALTAALGTAYTTTVAEGGDATFAVDVSGGTSTAAVVVNYVLDSSSTATSGTDYTAPGGKLTIAAAGTSGTITIATLTDAVLDPGETLVVKLTSATTDTRTVTVDDTATKTTTIQEEDMVAVSVAALLVEDNDQTPEDESDDRSRVEEGETASFVVTLDGEVSGTVSVPYATANVTAESGAGKDYTAATGTLEFTAGQTSKTIEVTTLEDGLNEAAETYTLTLTSVTGPAGVKLGTASATGTIEDDDELTAALGTTYTTSVAEGGDATYEVELSGGTSTAEVVVNYELDSSSTATSGTDYTAPGGKLTIAAAGTSGTITIATLTDAVLDPGETLVVKLTSATTDTRTVTVDDTATKTTTIQEEGMVSVSVAALLVEDNDQTPEDESDDRSRVEEGETASFVVTLDGEVSGTVSVPYATANVTAEAGAGKDYTAATGTLEFTAGQTSKTIEVTTLEDGLNEAAETYTLTLTSVTGPAGVKLGTASATGTIEDDDELTAALGTTYTTSVAEGGDATYEVELSGGTSTAEVVVNYELDSSSTAMSGTDYTAPAGS